VGDGTVLPVGVGLTVVVGVSVGVDVTSVDVGVGVAGDGEGDAVAVAVGSSPEQAIRLSEPRPSPPMMALRSTDLRVRLAETHPAAVQRSSIHSSR
jgi:hypothetical protein